MPNRDIVVVAGYFARCPLGGYGWQILHYVLGLRELGFDAYFYEDTAFHGDCFDPITGCMYTSPDHGIEALRALFERFDLGDRWIFWDAQRGQYHGQSQSNTMDILWSARMVLTLAPVTRLPRRHKEQKIFVDLDPGYTQLKLQQGDRVLRGLLAEHDLLFTIGEHIGTPHCPIPNGGFEWHPTRQPIVTQLWEAPPIDATAPFTTLGRWDEARRDISFLGATYGWSKRQQWMDYLELPQRSGARFLLAMDVEKRPDDKQRLQANGWDVVDPLRVSGDCEIYRQFIYDSQGEFTVAKELNVRLKTAWFSDRSACYLASGRPVITQSTGFEDLFPTGSGLFAFSNPEEALQAIEAIRSNPRQQSAAARRLALEHFEARRVVGAMMAKC